LVFQQELAEFARAGRGLRVALMGGHDRALHEDVPFPRERVDVADAALGG